MYDLKTYRNSIASIPLLPDELLAQIFAQYCLVETGGSFQTEWCKILYVCKRQKVCALTTSQLWSFIGNPRFGSSSRHGSLRRMLHWRKLSRGYPIYFRFHLTRPSMESKYYPILLEKTPIHRINSLEVSGNPAQLTEFLEAANPFVFTQGLALRDTSTPDPSGNGTIFIFPGHLFRFSVLRSLSLQNVPFASTTAFLQLSDPTRFCFKILANHIKRLQLCDIFSILRHCPQLVHLELMNAVDYTNPEEEPTVYLPVLDVIRLRENPPVAGAFLQTLQIPALTCLDFEIVEDLSCAESMFEDIGDHLRRAESPVFRSMSLSQATVIAHAQSSYHYENNTSFAAETIENICMLTTIPINFLAMGGQTTKKTLAMICSCKHVFSTLW